MLIGNTIAEIREVGYAILPNLISSSRLSKAAADAEGLLESTPVLMPGLDEPVQGRMCKGLFKKSRAFDDLMCHPTVLSIVRGVLAPEKCAANLAGCGIQLSTTMIKDVQPREKRRHFHRDDDFYKIPRPRPPVVVNTLWALDPFHKELGATMVVPKSHKWTGPVDQDPAYCVVEMHAGSVLLIDGSLWHNNGSNTTQTECRKALNCYYSRSELPQMEGLNLGLADHELDHLPEDLKAII